MKANTGLLALGLFAVAGVVMVSCGGSSDGDDNTGSAGTTSTSAGTTSKAGSSSSAGTSNNTSGTANNTGGTGNSTGGAGNNNGGANDFPGLGGAGFDVPGCPAGTMDGETCTPDEAQPGCQLNDTTYCACQAANTPTWTCIDTDDLLGAGGAGTGFGNATCPANAMTGDTCTNGPGLCAGQQCYCAANGMIQCLP